MVLLKKIKSLFSSHTEEEFKISRYAMPSSYLLAYVNGVSKQDAENYVNNYIKGLSYDKVSAKAIKEDEEFIVAKYKAQLRYFKEEIIHSLENATYGGFDKEGLKGLKNNVKIIISSIEKQKKAYLHLFEYFEKKINTFKEKKM